MTTRKRTLGIGTAVVVVTLFLFRENIAEWLDATGGNRLWEGVTLAPLWSALTAIGGFLLSPLMTHLYAFIGGALALILLNLWLQAKEGREAGFMTLSQVVDYLTSESQWARDTPVITDRAVQLELMDALAEGRVAFSGRELDPHGYLSPFLNVGPEHAKALYFDLDAIRSGASETMKMRSGYRGNRLLESRARKADVQKAWPPHQRKRRPFWRID